ncbi:CsbD family protein [Methylobacterium trifolii]|jgi:uncharacterized protein YjbJ (UPF0337 family)|uniref:CsbD-like domain-containing protein n=1 Tax=Methylobacterium trifolii TaxID=1003092 RepID=A0ABQ4U0U4_9HYPH|nr:CsbD family protein [Methylobacterium trifolii]GJE60767.1 hypothetical protein MPOCJGCO_2883 [Methylobacterium trifolii]
MVDTHRITGAAKELGGKVQGAVGDLTGSHRHSAQGRLHEAEGAAENLYGPARDAVRDVADQVEDAARHAGGRVRDAIDHLADRDEVEHRLHRAGDAAEAHFHDAERTARHVAREARAHAEDAYRAGGRHLHDARREAAHRISEHPVNALLVAGILGYGLSLLVHRRH